MWDEPPNLLWILPIITKQHDSKIEWACTPDAVDFVSRTGFEFKTKIKAGIPHKVSDIVLDEYLQCQFCLFCCQGDVDKWQLWTNKYDTDDYAGFEVKFDSELMETHIIPHLLEFERRVTDDMLQLYPRMPSTTKAALKAVVYKSMEQHVQMI